MKITKKYLISKSFLLTLIIITATGCKSVPTEYNSVAFNNAIDSNGVVTVGELKWQKCSAGQDPIKCTGEALGLGRRAAYKYCESLKLDNGDWRLPDIFELRELTKCESGKLPRNLDKILWRTQYILGAGCKDENKLQLTLPRGMNQPKIDTKLFPNTVSGIYWSGTNSVNRREENYQQIETYYYTSVDFETGKIQIIEGGTNIRRRYNPDDGEDFKAQVRCVKDAD